MGYYVKNFKIPLIFIVYIATSIVFLFSTFITKADSKEKFDLYLQLIDAKIQSINTKLDTMSNKNKE